MFKTNIELLGTLFLLALRVEMFCRIGGWVGGERQFHMHSLKRSHRLQSDHRDFGSGIFFMLAESYETRTNKKDFQRSHMALFERESKMTLKWSRFQS